MNRVLADCALMGLLVLLCWVYSGPPHRGYRCTAGPVRQEDLPKAGYAAPLHPHYLGQRRAHGAIDAELARSGGRLHHCPGCQCGRGNDVDTPGAGT